MRRLRADEIECRVGQFSKDGSKYSVLLYKTARTDMAVLDEMFGPMNWKTDYQTVGNSLFCTISVWDKDKNCWVSKQSNGSEGNIEAEKSVASDSMKRSGFMWGIGRELYTAPKIWLAKEVSQYNIFVKEITYAENGDINHLVISDGKSDVYTFNDKKINKPAKLELQTNEIPKPKFEATPKEISELEEKANLVGELDKLGTNLNSLCAYFKVEKVEQLTVEQLKKALEMKSRA